MKQVDKDPHAPEEARILVSKLLAFSSSNFDLPLLLSTLFHVIELFDTLLCV